MHTSPLKDSHSMYIFCTYLQCIWFIITRFLFSHLFTPISHALGWNQFTFLNILFHMYGIRLRRQSFISNICGINLMNSCYSLQSWKQHVFSNFTLMVTVKPQFFSQKTIIIHFRINLFNVHFETLIYLQSQLLVFNLRYIFTKPCNF